MHSLIVGQTSCVSDTELGTAIVATAARDRGSNVIRVWVGDRGAVPVPVSLRTLHCVLAGHATRCWPPSVCSALKGAIRASGGPTGEKPMTCPCWSTAIQRPVEAQDTAASALPGAGTCRGPRLITYRREADPACSGSNVIAAPCPPTATHSDAAGQATPVRARVRSIAYADQALGSAGSNETSRPAESTATHSVDVGHARSTRPESAPALRNTGADHTNAALALAGASHNTPAARTPNNHAGRPRQRAPFPSWPGTVLHTVTGSRQVSPGLLGPQRNVRRAAAVAAGTPGHRRRDERPQARALPGRRRL